MDAQVGGEDDTQQATCARCGARASVDAAIVRAGVARATLVSEYVRPSVGSCVVEVVKALIAFPDGRIARGDGHSREEAMLNALERAGVDT